MHQFNAAPLPMVWLLNGFSTAEAAGRLVRYERLHDLLISLRVAVVLKPALLTAAELIYLRRGLDASQTELADVLGTSEQTLSLWERGSHSIPRAVDTLLRKHCLEQRELKGHPAAKQTVASLAMNSRGDADFLYEGSFSGSSWAFSYRPTPLLHASSEAPAISTVLGNSQSMAVRRTLAVPERTYQVIALTEIGLKLDATQAATLQGATLVDWGSIAPQNLSTSHAYN